MTQRIKAEGPSLVAALAAGVAQLADCEVEEVDLKVNAPHLDPEATRVVRLVFEVDPVDREAADGSAGDAPTTDAPTTEPARAEPRPVVAEELDEEAEAAADFIEELLDLLGLPGDLKLRVFEDHAEVEVVDVGSGALIGRRGQTLEALQELVRCSLQREFQRRARVKIDVEGYRVRRLEKLQEKALEVIERVQDRGGSERLEPMDVFERKAIHRLVADHEGVDSRSQGREPGRRVIIEEE